jgi:BirA family biotin operon repressor/biotin-[acetyl-CoA-carboxylase] ligase
MIIGSKLYRTKMCTNSLAWAREHIDSAPDGSVFLADKLANAYGRQGRAWFIYPGQLLITLLLKPALFHRCCLEEIPIRLNQLNMALSIGVASTLSKYGIGIKWPNDFVVQNKKVGGLLAHVVWQNNWPAGVIIGIGININTQFDKNDELFPIATSLAMVAEQDFDMRLLYRELLKNLDEAYALWGSSKFDEIYRQWRLLQVCLGKQLTIHQKNGQLMSGTMSQVLPNGDMIMSVSKKGSVIIPFCIVSDVALRE